MNPVSSTFGSWKDRLTYLLAEAQFLVAGVLVSAAVFIILVRPEIPGVPPIFMGWFAAILLLGPPLFGFFVWLIHLLRQRNMVTVFEIDAARGVREKWYVEPEIWEEREVDGPSPFFEEESDSWEVRQFDWDAELEQLRVTGCHLSLMQDSRLLTFKTLVYDLHETFAGEWKEKIMARARETKRGLEQQEAIVNSQAEASERGLMEPKTIVSETWEQSLEDLRQDDDLLEIDDFETYAEQEEASVAREPYGPPEPSDNGSEP